MATKWATTVTNGYAGGDGEAREIPDEGQQPAVLVGLVDLGTHMRSYKGEPPKPSRQIAVIWELTEAPMSGTKGRNHILSEKYTFSLNEKSGFRHMIERLSRKFKPDENIEVDKFLGLKAILKVEHAVSGSGKTYARVAKDGVAEPQKGVVVPPAKEKMFAHHVTDPIEAIPHWTPWVYGESAADVIRKSQEHAGNGSRNAPKMKADEVALGDGGVEPESNSDDQIPF
jgi:hypothetical protein